MRRRAAALVNGAAHGLRYDFVGMCVAVAFAWLSFTPSLLPRPPMFQGVLVGVTAVLGYGVGVTGAWLFRELTDRLPPSTSRHAWRVLTVVAVVGSVLVIGWGEWSQRAMRAEVGVGAVHPAQVLLIPVLAVLLFIVLVALGRGCRRLYQKVVWRLSRRMRPRAARAVGLVLLTVGAAMLFSGVLWDGAVRLADTTFAVRDQTTPEGLEQPLSPQRSGSPDSLIAWDTLGREGRTFTGGGPSAEDISVLSGTRALEPVRVYAGLSSADDAEARARLAVRDLARAGGFERSQLLVVTTTGTGWVEPSAAASFEYLTDGDSATVAMQYSHLPSWLSFLVDQERAREAGRELFDAVYRYWTRMDPGDRPELYVFGESLGSFGGETAFTGELDMRNRLDGALFVGPPSFNPMYRDFVDDRQPGTPEVEPVYRQGRVVRFSLRARDPIEPVGRRWSEPRILYLQHATDPVTWWSPSLIWDRPDWLEEAPGRGVPGTMRWIPGVTFWQTSADLALAFDLPPEQGHNFTGEHADAWAVVLRSTDWDEDQVAELRALLQGSG